MNFNPFAENKTSSVSMFAKEKKRQAQATSEAVAVLEEKFSTKEYLGVKMDYETLTFFKGFVSQVGEEASMRIVKNVGTHINDAGALTKLSCAFTQITSLPKLPAGLTWLSCDNTQITSLPELPTGLTWLSCCKTQITSLPELPTGLTKLHFTGTPLAKDRGFMYKLIEDHPNVDINC